LGNPHSNGSQESSAAVPVFKVARGSDLLTCRICGSIGEHQTYVAREMMFGTRENFTYFTCDDCECLQIAEVPRDLARFYADSYYSRHLAQEQVKTSLLISFLQKQRCRNALFGRGFKIDRFLSNFVDFPEALPQMGPILKLAGAKSFNDGILDVGCGNYSAWLAMAKSLGFRNLLGIDPFIDSDCTSDGIRIIKKSLHQIQGTYSLISFHHSLEHIPDQQGTMHKVKELLSPKGVCLIRIPIVSSYVWQKYGVNWAELDAPRHLYLHSKKSIQLLASYAGLELVDTVYDSVEFEFAASEQYGKDIPLNAPNSYMIDLQKSIFTTEQIKFFEQEACRVNKERVGGRAGFYFRHQNI
jgi:hypothetical protein